MLTEVLQKSIILIVGLIFLVSVTKIIFRSKNVNRTERAQIFKAADYFNVGLIMLCFVITLTYGFINHYELKKSVHSIISLNYSEASQAQNSNGTRFNMSEIICDEVVENAIRKGALEKVTTKQLKDCLKVYPCVEGNVDDKSQYHISTEFVVEYQAS